MRLRASLLLLAVTAAVPVLALTVIAAVYVYDRENANFISSAKVRNRATLEAVDAELRGTVNTLQALATSEAIDRKDYAAFHREAQTVLATQAHWRNIVLVTPQGRQVVNARLPFEPGRSEPPVENRSLRAALAEGRPSVSDITFSPRSGTEAGIAVRLPVQRGGETVNVLTAVVKTSVFQQILENQRLPANWVSGLVGTDGRLIARVPAVAPGRFASDEYRAYVAREPEGWYRGRTLEGNDTFTAFSRSELTGWSIGYAIPSDALVGGPARAAGLFAAGILLSVLSAGAIGYWLTRRIAAPIAELAEAAPHLPSGQPPAAIGSAIDEVSALAQALAETAGAIQRRDAELVRRGEELARQAEELRQVDANRTRFLALISHELRGPIAPLRNGLLLLAADGDPKKQAQVRAMMDRQLSLLTRLVNDLVDLGRIGRGDLQLDLKPLALDTVVQASVDMVKPQMQDKRHSLVVRHAPGAIQVNGDADRLCQVVANLLTNACRYTPEGGHIEVSLSQEEGEAVIAVADDGIGFTRADGLRMFDMFVRLAPQGAPTPGSLGIGLAVARAIVGLHGGRIDAHSDGPGRGACFRVQLPLVASAMDRAQAVGIPADPAT